MAKSPAPKAAKKAKSMKAGYTELGSSLDGFFKREAGNSVEGVLRGTFKTRGKFGERNVFRIEVCEGETTVEDKEGEKVVEQGALIGLDETGYTKRLGSLKEGTCVFIACEGKGPAEKDPWVFRIGVADVQV